MAALAVDIGAAAVDKVRVGPAEWVRSLIAGVVGIARMDWGSIGEDTADRIAATAVDIVGPLAVLADMRVAAAAAADTASAFDAGEVGLADLVEMFVE